jgi:capsular polysaccharide biosynthesis protein
MDLWDVAKLMGRRWYVALPMLLLTAAATWWTVSTVKPDYTATTNVTLLPPTLRNDAPTATARKVNPWDTESLTIATLTYLNSKRLHDQMKAEGFAHVWQADTDLRFSSLIVIKVTAEGREQAQRSARELQQRVTREVARQQAKYPLKPGEQITTNPFDNGDNVETATSKVKRALIVVIGIGMILTIAMTVGLDAILRWRSARRAHGSVAVARQGRATAAEPPKPIAPITVGTLNGSPVTKTVADPSNEETRRIPQSVYRSVLREAGEEKPTTVITKPGGPSPATSKAGPKSPPKAAPKATPEPAAKAVPNEEHVTAPEEATLVLPLSNMPWLPRPTKPARSEPSATKPAGSGGEAARPEPPATKPAGSGGEAARPAQSATGPDRSAEPTTVIKVATPEDETAETGTR